MDSELLSGLKSALDLVQSQLQILAGRDSRTTFNGGTYNNAQRDIYNNYAFHYHLHHQKSGKIVMHCRAL